MADTTDDDATAADAEDDAEVLAHLPRQSRDTAAAGAPAVPSGAGGAERGRYGGDPRRHRGEGHRTAGPPPPSARGRGRLVVAIWEAVTNTMAHGRTPATAVNICLSPAGDEVIATVTDHGPGFDPDAVPDPLAPPHRLRPGGPGLLLIHRYTDGVDYTFPPHGGTVVTLRASIPT
jgi:serine/threonine-protein kinase RsbW